MTASEKRIPAHRVDLVFDHADQTPLQGNAPQVNVGVWRLAMHCSGLNDSLRRGFLVLPPKQNCPYRGDHRSIDVFHADLPSISVTIADPCLVTIPLRSLT